MLMICMNLARSHSSWANFRQPPGPIWSSGAKSMKSNVVRDVNHSSSDCSNRPRTSSCCWVPLCYTAVCSTTWAILMRSCAIAMTGTGSCGHGSYRCQCFYIAPLHPEKRGHQQNMPRDWKTGERYMALMLKRSMERRPKSFGEARSLTPLVASLESAPPPKKSV